MEPLLNEEKAEQALARQEQPSYESAREQVEAEALAESKRLTAGPITALDALLDQTVLMTTSDVAKIIGVGSDAVKSLRKSGSGPRYLRMGSHAQSPVKYVPGDVRDWLISCRVETVDSLRDK